VVYDAELVALMRHGHYLILKFVFSYPAAYHLPFDVVVVWRIGTANTRRMFFYSIFLSIEENLNLVNYLLI
jgi:hypothetical protein